MTAIIIPRRHYTQPQGRVAPLERWDFLQAGGVGQSGYTGVTSQVPGISYGRAGAGILTSTSAAAKFPPVMTGEYFGCICVCVIQKTGPFVTYSHFLDTKAEVSGVKGMYEFAGTARFEFNCTAGRALVSGPADWQALNVIACAYNDANGASLYVNGVLQGTTSPRGRILQQGSAVWLGTEMQSSVTPAFNGLHYLSAIRFDRWDEAYAQELSANPWQLFRADPIRIYSLPTGAISINSITASNITQTGARITLGLTR